MKKKGFSLIEVLLASSSTLLVLALSFGLFKNITEEIRFNKTLSITEDVLMAVKELSFKNIKPKGSFYSFDEIKFLLSKDSISRISSDKSFIQLPTGEQITLYEVQFEKDGGAFPSLLITNKNALKGTSEDPRMNTNQCIKYVSHFKALTNIKFNGASSNGAIIYKNNMTNQDIYDYCLTDRVMKYIHISS